MQQFKSSNPGLEIHISDIRPQLVCEVQDDHLGVLGYLVIDRVLGNAAIGGIRMAPNASPP